MLAFINMRLIIVDILSMVEEQNLQQLVQDQQQQQQ
jgi:hypothetical protein